MNIKLTIIMTTVAKFEEGNIYEMRFIGDSELKPRFICTKRTEKMVTMESLKGGEVIKRRIRTWSDTEVIVDGNYSMAPSIRASRVVA